jgi:hypothetical protein
MLSNDAIFAGNEVLAVLDIIEPVLPVPIPARVNQMIAAVEESELEAAVKTRAVSALLIGEGYHLINSGNLADPHYFPTLDAMREDLTRQVNSLRRI